MDYEKHISFLKYPDKSSRELKVSRSILQYIRILLKRNVMIVLLHFFLFSLKYIWFIMCIYVFIYIYTQIHTYEFSGGTIVKDSSANAGDARVVGLIPESGRSPGVGNGNLVQYSCLDNSTDRGAWWAIVHGVTKSRMWLSTWICVYIYIYILFPILFHDRLLYWR